MSTDPDRPIRPPARRVGMPIADLPASLPDVNGRATNRPVSTAAAEAEPPADRVFPPEAERPAEQPASKMPPLGERTIADILDLLAKPFHLAHIELKPGATTGDKARALALAYVDTRIYQKRLDYLAGVAGWAAHFEPWGPTRIICRLTILGVTKEATGEGDEKDPNCGTIAEAQAFKRACSAFGCGRYLYDLPQIWVEYDVKRRGFVDAAGAARRIYEQAGLPVK